MASQEVQQRKVTYSVADIVKLVGPPDPDPGSERSKRMWPPAKAHKGKLGKITCDRGAANADGADYGVKTLDGTSHAWHHVSHIKKAKKWEVKKWERSQ